LLTIGLFAGGAGKFLCLKSLGSIAKLKEFRKMLRVESYFFGLTKLKKNQQERIRMIIFQHGIIQRRDDMNLNKILRD